MSVELPRGGTGGALWIGDAGTGGGEDESHCGDGEKGPGEGCDDGNARPGDGCSGTCRLEPGYVCETPGEPCVSTAKCGDGFLTNEPCDDGNTESNDGCSDTCQVEQGYRCEKPGEPCVPTQTSECGNGGVEFGETCDDGDAEPGDGCDASCKVEDGFRCPNPGSPCVPEAKCGDGVRSPREQCDDGGVEPGDGCDASCRMEGPYWDCSEEGEPCVSLVECGDGKALGEEEECDDGDNDDLNGCSNTCTLTPGWVCPPGGGACWIRCGDGAVAGTEQCDDGGNAPDDGCSPICQLEHGFKCEGEPSVCTQTVCGDGKKEGTEQCDDGNVLPFDGCSPTCTNEPGCVDANGNRKACDAVCGDGLKFPTEACDDGNTQSGDGCSETCAIEPGYQCTTSEIPNQIDLPILYRDFQPGAPPAGNTGHPDFEWTSGSPNGWMFGGAYFNAGTGSQNRINYPTSATQASPNTYDAPSVLTGNLTRFVRPALGNAGTLLGKPVFTATCPLNANGTSGSWLRRNGIYYCANTVQSAESFSQWFTDSASSTAVPSTLTLLRCPATLPVTPANDPLNRVCTNTTGDANTFLFDSDRMLPNGDVCAGTAACDGFYPLDARPGTKYTDCGTSSPNGVANQHNFHFTSEVRYWFQYDAAAAATLTFTGDDDVFVFVNGRLVVDLGGVHNRIVGSVTINAQTQDLANPRALLNLTNGAIYEIAVFQAERNTCASNYRLQLKNFILGRSTCLPKCGDGVATPDEACDRGEDNVDAGEETYGKCTTSCNLGPRCGDGLVQADAGEECDNGLNNDTYSFSQYACATGCKLPPSCGDGNVDVLGGELCDKGDENSDEAYGPNLCSASCEPAPYCGDRAVDVDFGEGCDDGLNNGMPGSCTPDCADHVPLPSCGNGEPDPGEECDDGDENGTEGSSCDPQCRLRCGNGFKDPGEECDDGTNDGSYGGCNPDCTPAGYCGDGKTNGPEQCDEGDENGDEPQYGEDKCSASCRRAPYCGDGQIQVSFDEECDSTPGCDNECQNVIPK